MKNIYDIGYIMSKNNQNVDIEMSKEVKNKIINKLVENERNIQNGERTFSESEMNAILDWTMAKYV